MLNKYITYAFIIYINLYANILTAHELNMLNKTEKKYEISICAIFKNEALNLKEWIEYHFALGVDHFYLYNIGSSDHYQQALKTYIANNTVTLVNWPEAMVYHDKNTLQWALSTQIPAYENAVNFLARDETQWLVLLDINEFLVLPERNIKKLLNHYNEFPGITVHSEFFEKKPSNMLNEKKLRDESDMLSEFSIDVIDKAVAKIIFKPDQCLGFNWPPYQCRFKEFVSCIEADPQELRVKRCINRNAAHGPSKKTRESKEEITYPIHSEKMNENRNTPIYQHVPEFLKKLKCNLTERL